jgi:hypothetical protein
MKMTLFKAMAVHKKTYCNMYAMEWPLLGNVQAL